MTNRHSDNPEEDQLWRSTPATGGGLGSRIHQLEVLHAFALKQVELDSLEDILWNLARTAIGRLGFVDCVIYLVNESGDTLLQRAAHGPKNPIAQDIYKPITIPVGQGIVGAVAATGKPLRIDDTRNDPRYIEDDEKRLSELAVPIIHDGKVIGVLDSEHPEPGFFTDEHLALFSTLASLASTRIDTAMALERLRRSVADLRNARDDLARQASELLAARKAAETASREKSQFLANMSHEIRTPMTAIVGYADLLSRPDQAETDRTNWAGQVKRNADYLLQLVNELLDLSRIESGVFEPQLQPCDPASLFRDAFDLVAPRAAAKLLKLEPPDLTGLPERVALDVTRVRQICVNLLTNAVKYTREGRIDFDCRRLDADSETPKFEIVVRDSGIGIEADSLERIFHPFTQERTLDAVRDGAGLGLAISRAFARGLGGELTVQSAINKGSTFTVIVPYVLLDPETCAPVQPEAPTFASPPPLPLQGRSVLVVEDAASIAMLLGHLLSTAGAEVRLAANGAEGERAVKEAAEAGSLPDLVVMDMMMPVMDGYETTRRLRAAGIGTKIVALTAFASNEDRDRCLEAGCDHYLTKPIDPTSFVDRISAFMR